jgi:hypothetical protein
MDADDNVKNANKCGLGYYFVLSFIMELLQVFVTDFVSLWGERIKLLLLI